MSFKSAEVTLSAAVAQNGTITVAYPAGTDSGTYAGAYAHKAWFAGLQYMGSAPTDFSVSFGASNITVTYLAATTLPNGSRVNFQFDLLGPDDNDFNTKVDDVHNVAPLTPFVINLGAPDTADAGGVIASQSITAASGPATGINGALASGGVATFDRPRNVVAAWTGTAVMTVTGTDEYGETVVESSASGTSLTGKKAFKTVTDVSVSADVTLATVGSGDVLGLPVALPQKGLVVREMEDGAAPTAGTIVAAVRSTATATTGDVRGTYDPNSACDGSKAFELLALLPDPTDKGVPQYAG